MRPAGPPARGSIAPPLADFWNIDESTREDLLTRGIVAAHAYHYEHNAAYRNTVAAHEIGSWAAPGDVSRLLRATSLSFKSYADILGTSFPQEHPAEFFHWVEEQSSLDLHAAGRPRVRYRSLGALLGAVEHACRGANLEMSVSSGTSGRMSLIPRDRGTNDLATESFYLSLRRYLGVTADFAAVFLTSKHTRVAVPRMTLAGLRRVGVTPGKIHFAVPLGAGPDQMRMRTGLSYHRGWRGGFERHVSRPLWTSLQSRLVDGQMAESAFSRLVTAGAHDEKVLVFGTLSQLRKLASFVLGGGRTLTLAPGSLVVTWGGKREPAAQTPAQMRRDLLDAFRLSSGEPVPIRDLYGMAEAAWAAVQCADGNYHLPPWVHAVTLDDAGAVQTGPRCTGLLAFFDPYGGGDLFPAFFRTADRVTLVRNAACSCGEEGGYLAPASVQRLGLPDDAPRKTLQ
jgi:hypothetical protein